MKKTIFLNFPFVVLWLSVIFIPNAEALGMLKETHTYFVDRDAPDHLVQNIEDYPHRVSQAREHTAKSYKGEFYTVSVSYPVHWKFKTSWRHTCGLTVDAKVSNDPSERFGFVIKHWAIKDMKGKTLHGQAERQFGSTFGEKPGRPEQILNQEFRYKGLAESFDFYYDIPKHVKQLTLEFEVEITSPKGEKITVKDSIPLKRATFKTNFFEGLLP